MRCEAKDIDEDLRYLASVHLNEPMSPSPASEYFRSLDRLVDACRLKGVDHHFVMEQVLREMRERR